MTLSFSKSLPEMYERALVPALFRPFAEQLLDDARLTPGDRVLDVACGTGIVARLAKGRVGESPKVVGVDTSPHMLAVARSLDGEIDWRDGDAAALPLREGEQFELLTCHQGLQFFPDREAAVRQMRRATTAGGRVAVATWCSDEGPFLRELRRVAERHVGPVTDRRHCFGEAAAIEALFRGAGFRGARSRSVTRTVRYDDGSVFVRLNASALVGMSEAAKAMSDGEKERLIDAIVRDSAAVTRDASDGSALSYDISSTVVTAVA